jgi:hypothetical protein
MPEYFAPGIISVDENFEHSAAVFSPDGNEVFWCTNVGFYTDERVVGNLRLYFMKKVNNQWTSPSIAPFAEDYRVERPVFSPDGARLYFERFSNLDYESDMDIYMVERLSEGWSEPVSVSPFINTAAMERLHCVTADGSLYFSRDPFTKQEEIYVSRWGENGFTKPEKLGKSYNSEMYEVIIMMEPNAKFMLIGQIDIQHNKPTLVISFRKADGSWTDRISLPYHCGGFLALSPDGKYLFLENEGIQWVSTWFVEELRPKGIK